ncbi:uncharacterized protein ACIB01_003682 isoform 2-T2 [Guaruba guarouba]
MQQAIPCSAVGQLPRLEMTFEDFIGVVVIAIVCQCFSNGTEKRSPEGTTLGYEEKFSCMEKMLLTLKISFERLIKKCPEIKDILRFREQRGKAHRPKKERCVCEFPLRRSSSTSHTHFGLLTSVKMSIQWLKNHRSA